MNFGIRRFGLGLRQAAMAMHKFQPITTCGLRCLSIAAKTEKKAQTIPRDRIKSFTVGKSIGQGAQAKVHAGLLELIHGESVDVAFRILLVSQKRFSLSKALGKYLNFFDRKSREKESAIKEMMLKDVESELKTVSHFRDHPNILQIVVSDPIEMENKEVALAIELGQGSIDDLLKGDMDASSLLNLLADAVDGLAHMHQKGFVHSDIKPENIFVSRDGKRGLVGDFGGTTKIGEDNKILTKHYADNRVPEGDVRKNTIHDDHYSLGWTIVDLVNLPDMLDSNNEAHMAFKQEVNQFSMQLLDEETQMPTEDIASKLREFSKKAKELGCQPLGDKNQKESLNATQEKRALPVKELTD